PNHLSSECIPPRGERLDAPLNGVVGGVARIVRCKRLGGCPERGHRERAKWRVHLLVYLREGDEASALLQGQWTSVAFKYLGYDAPVVDIVILQTEDRKSTRLNSSHVSISYAV